MRVVQCWDDGVSSDLQLVDILHRHNAKSTFNLNPGLYGNQRRAAWNYRGKELVYLGWSEMAEVYAGFMIANHTATHKRLTEEAPEAVRREIRDGRARLQDFFGQPVDGFAYPFGVYNPEVMESVREAGHLYARTVVGVDHPFPPDDPMAFHPSCHVLADDFWARYERAKSGGVFYFWGHSFEFTSADQWAEFDAKIARISSDPDTVWGNVADLFIGTATFREAEEV